MTSTIGQNSAHSARPMYDPELRRTPRDLANTQQVLDLCTVASSRAAAVRMCQPIGMWPERSALLDIPLFNMHLQTRGDRLHVFDGGISQRLLLYVGNWVFDKAGPAGLSVLNAAAHLDLFRADNSQRVTTFLGRLQNVSKQK